MFISRWVAFAFFHRVLHIFKLLVGLFVYVGEVAADLLKTPMQNRQHVQGRLRLSFQSPNFVVRLRLACASLFQAAFFPIWSSQRSSRLMLHLFSVIQSDALVFRTRGYPPPSVLALAPSVTGSFLGSSLLPHSLQPVGSVRACCHLREYHAGADLLHPDCETSSKK